MNADRLPPAPPPTEPPRRQRQRGGRPSLIRRIAERDGDSVSWFAVAVEACNLRDAPTIAMAQNELRKLGWLLQRADDVAARPGVVDYRDAAQSQ